MTTGNGRSQIKREVLPIPDQPYAGPVTYDAKDPETKFPKIEPLRPPQGAPNVLICLVDDVGFGASSAFGGPINTPTAERLASQGLKYTRFHTTALCSPTRAAMLSGRNHHTVGMGSITEMATSAPGQNSLRPNTCAPIAETLRLNGYSTAQFGKCHEVPAWEANPAGPFDHWPNPGGGFEYFYGFIGGEANQYFPAIYENVTPVEPSKTPEEGYHLTEDLADRAINWIQQEKALTPDKPFFAYWAPGATHAPHHVPKEWADKYRGKFSQGWDRVREETFARQKRLGVIPQDAELTAFNPEVPHWEDTPDELKPVLERQMEVYAGFLEHTDHHFGRVVDALERLNILDNTLIYYIIGDNGASAEGTLNGTFNEMINFNGFAEFETPEFLREHMEALGTPEAYNHYAVGWAHALCTPYQWTKQVASHWGGTRNGTIVHWPKSISDHGGIRNQFQHVIDIAPTILEAVGLPQPTEVHGVTQHPLEGFSMSSTFNNAAAPETHTTQYFEIMGNRGIYHEGWTAVTRHRIPWKIIGAETVPFDEDKWELYEPGDWTQARDIAGENQQKLEELKRLFLIEAARYNVLPLDDRGMERGNPDIAGRPELITGRSQILFGGMGNLNEHAVINTKNKSHSITAEVVVSEEPAEGVIISQGGRNGGWSLYAKDGKLKYCYNLLGLKQTYVESDRPIGRSEHQVRMEFKYDGGGMAKGGAVSLYIDGHKAGEGRVDATQPIIFSADEMTSVGRETGSGVSPDYPVHGNEFKGRVLGVEIDVEEEGEEHFIDPERRYAALMARQ